MIGARAAVSIAGMQNWISRWLSILLLGALIAFGIGNQAVASNSMMPDMAPFCAASAAMPAMDCHGGSAPGGCSGGLAACALGCTAPGLALPLPVQLDERIAASRAAAAPTTDPADGLMVPPNLPPPRRFDAS